MTAAQSSDDLDLEIARSRDALISLAKSGNEAGFLKVKEHLRALQLKSADRLMDQVRRSRILDPVQAREALRAAEALLKNYVRSTDK